MNKIFPLYRDKTLDGFETSTSELEQALQLTAAYINNLKVMKDQGRGITYVGQNGVGKTHLACCVLTAAQDAGFKIECIELSTYIDLRQEMFKLDSNDDRFDYVSERLRYIENIARFLLLDDLGREHESRSGWSNERVFDLLRFRHNRLLPTLITTNVPINVLGERYTEGLSSFLQEATTVISMEGEDYRWSMGN